MRHFEDRVQVQAQVYTNFKFLEYQMCKQENKLLENVQLTKEACALVHYVLNATQHTDTCTFGEHELTLTAAIQNLPRNRFLI